MQLRHGTFGCAPIRHRPRTVSPMRVFKVRRVLGLGRQVDPRGAPVRRSNNAVEAVTKVGVERRVDPPPAISRLAPSTKRHNQHHACCRHRRAVTSVSHAIRK